ncbi:MAG: N-formylglutamate amidohydrolase [Pseudomonadota bacterium]
MGIENHTETIAVEIQRRAPIFIFCDHASNAIPQELNDLGLPEDILQTHIAWDIGAEALTDALGDMLDASVLKSCFSRLVVDVNRSVESKDVIPQVSDQIPVPGNQMLDIAGRAARIERFHEAYHGRLSAALDHACLAGRPFVVSIHSFTKRLMGAAEDRIWPIGLLWREDEPSARAVIDHLHRETGWPIGDNEPYDARVFNYSVDRHVGPRGLPHITLEVRQDMIGNSEGVYRIVHLLAGAILHAARLAGVHIGTDVTQ